MGEDRRVNLDVVPTMLLGFLCGLMLGVSMNLGRIASALERAYPDPAKVSK